VIAYKFLRRDGTSVFTGFSWPLPGEGSPGEWIEADLEPCRSGIHACRVAHLPLWAGQVMYEVELAGDIAMDGTKVIGSRGRLTRRLEAWDELRDSYTRMCADRAHELARAPTPALEEWEAVIEPALGEGPALLGFVTARIAEELSGAEGYRAERARQSQWLAERLGLQTSEE